MAQKRASNTGVAGLQSWRSCREITPAAGVGDQTGAPFRGVMVDTDGDYEVIFADDTASVTLPLKAGQQYGFTLRRVISAAGTIWGGS